MAERSIHPTKRILISFFVFFASFCWVYYLTKLGDVAIWGAVILAFATACLCATKRPAKKVTNKKIAKQLALQFTLYGDDNVIQNLYCYLGYQTTGQSSTFVATKNNQKTYVVVDFGTKNANCDKIVTASKVALKHDCKQVAYFCTGADADVSKYLDMLPVQVSIFDAYATFDILDKYNKLPQIKINKRVQNSPVLQYAFNKKRAKNYFVSSAFIFALSFLSFWPLYSLVWASLFALAGIYSKFNKRMVNGVEKKTLVFDINATVSSVAKRMIGGSLYQVELWHNGKLVKSFTFYQLDAILKNCNPNDKLICLNYQQ